MGNKNHRPAPKLPPISSMLEWDLEHQISVYLRMIKQLVPEHRRDLKRAGRYVAPPKELEWRIAALSAFWGEQRKTAELHPDFFKWPSTKAWLGNGPFTAKELSPEGMLSIMGYSVGQSGDLTDQERRRLLDHIFSENLPVIPSVASRNEWGDPETPKRLKKMANCLASFCRNAKRRSDRDMDLAIARWEADLRYLRDKFYFGKFTFGWPDTTTEYLDPATVYVIQPGGR